MLIAVAAALRHLEDLHRRADDEIVGVPHAACGEQRDEVLALVLLDEGAEIVGADGEAGADVGQRERLVGVVRLDDRHGAVAEQLRALRAVARDDLTRIHAQAAQLVPHGLAALGETDARIDRVVRDKRGQRLLL